MPGHPGIRRPTGSPHGLPQSRALRSWVAVTSISGCTAFGLLVARGLTAVAVTLIAGVLLLGLMVFGRRRIAPVLWSGVAFTAPLQGVRVGSALALSDLLIVVALLAILPEVTRGWRQVVPGGVAMAFGVLVTAGLVGTFFAPSTVESISVLFKIVLAAAGSIVAMVLWRPNREELRRFAWLWLAGATASAVWGLISPRGLYAGRTAGLTTHPNHFGLVCALGVSLGLGLALSSAGRARLAALACTVVLTGGVGVSGSRAALLALVVAVGATAILTRRLRLLVAAASIAILASTGVVIGIVKIPDSHALSRLVGGGAAAASDVEREQAREAALATIGRHPLTGEGFGLALAAHSIYLQALVVGGPLALLGFLGVSGLIVRTGLGVSRRARGGRDGPLLAGLTAGYIAYLSSGIFDNILWDRYLWTYIGLLLTFAAASRRSSQQPASISRRAAIGSPAPVPASL